MIKPGRSHSVIVSETRWGISSSCQTTASVRFVDFSIIQLITNSHGVCVTVDGEFEPVFPYELLKCRALSLQSEEGLQHVCSHTGLGIH